MKFLRFLFILIALTFTHSASLAQCAMCKATAESNTSVGGGLNAGIEYILVVPYILLGSFVIFVFRGKLKSFWKDLTGKNKEVKKVYSAEEWY